MTVNERFIVNPTKDDDSDDDSDDDLLDFIKARKPKAKAHSVKGKGGGESVEGLRREIENINKEIEEEGGLLGGWHPQEHDFFLALWTQVFGSNRSHVPEQGSSHFRKSMTMLRERGVSSVPSRTGDELERHALWYCSFLRRVARKKETLEKWRKVRAEQEEAQLTELDEVPPLSYSTSSLFDLSCVHRLNR